MKGILVADRVAFDAGQKPGGLGGKGASQRRPVKKEGGRNKMAGLCSTIRRRAIEPEIDLVRGKDWEVERLKSQGLVESINGIWGERGISPLSGRGQETGSRK